jgi:uncharacterized protein (TIGR03067 family)
MLQGTWSCVSGQNDGRAIPDDVCAKLRLQLTETIYKTTLGEQLLFEGEYRVNTQVQPNEIDILATSGPFQGQSALGIYEQSGNDLKLAYVMPGGKARPSQFGSIAGSGVANTVWQRIS